MTVVEPFFQLFAYSPLNVELVVRYLHAGYSAQELRQIYGNLEQLTKALALHDALNRARAIA